MDQDFMSRAVCFFILGVLAVVGCSSGNPEPGEVKLHPYQGQYKDTDRYKKIFGSFQQKFSRSMGKLRKEWGLEPTGSGDIHVKIIDQGTKDWEVFAKVRTKENFSSSKHYLWLNTEIFLRKEVDLQQVLDHEVVHLVMRNVMGYDSYSQLPEWVQEGLTVYFADEITLHMNRQLSIREQPDRLMTGLKEEIDSRLPYPYSGLAIQYLATRNSSGKDHTVKSFVQSIVRGRSVNQALNQSAGFSLEKFRQRVRKYAQKKIDRQSRGLARFKSGQEKLFDDRYVEARNDFNRVIDRYPKLPYAAKSSYYRARSYYDQQNYAKARRAFESFIDKYRSVTGLYDEALLYQGLCSYGLGEYDRAKQYLRELTRLHPVANQWNRGKYFLAKSLQQLGNEKQAKKHFRQLVNQATRKGKYINKSSETPRSVTSFSECWDV
ncbi:MAG: tol-pal system YbgF family protein [bacterium]